MILFQINILQEQNRDAKPEKLILPRNSTSGENLCWLQF